MPSHPAESPAKKQSKWSAEEDALIIELRGSGMKWEDISKRLPGRSAISCRLHYQNYLERRSEWDEERKNKLARLYERFKPEMWAKVAEEMAVPWRAAEAMHWQLGEADMARRAGVVPFSLSSMPMDTAIPGGGHRTSPGRGHSHSQSHSSIMSTSGSSSGRYSRPATAHSTPGSVRATGTHPGRIIAARRDSNPRSAAPGSPGDVFPLAALSGLGTGGMGRGGPPMLPSVAEMTTGVSPWSTPAYSSIPMEGSGMGYMGQGPLRGPGPLLPSIGMMGRSDTKRRASPDIEPREPIRRRQ